MKSALSKHLFPAIAFDNLQDLVSCLSSILDDPEVEVLRIRNRFSPEYDSKQTAGWRDVNLILRIKSEESRTLGVDRHCCELQLVTKGFIRWRNDFKHAMYLKFRQCRYYSTSWAWLGRLRLQKSYRTTCRPHRLYSEGASRIIDATVTSQVLQSVRDDEEANLQASDSNERTTAPTNPTEVLPAESNHGIHEAVREQPVRERPCQNTIEDTSRVIQTLILQRSVWPSNILDLMLIKARHGFAKASVTNVLYTKRPITAGFSKPPLWFAVLLFVGVVCGFRLLPALLDFWSGYASPGMYFKLIALKCMGGPCNMTEAVSKGARFGVRQSGCPYGVHVTQLRTTPGEISVTYSHNVLANSWYFEAANMDPALYPNNYRLEGSTDGEIWEVLSKGPCSLFVNRTHPQPATCFGADYLLTNSSGEQQLRLAPPIWVNIRELSLCVSCLGLLGAVLVAARDRPSLSKHMFGGALLLSSVLYIASAWIEAVTITHASNDSSTSWMLWGLVFMGLGASVQTETHFLFSLFGFFIGSIGVIVYHSTIVLTSDGPQLFSSIVSRWIALIVLGTTSVFVCSVKALDNRRRYMSIIDDKQLYDSEWDRLWQSQPEQLQRLGDALRRIHESGTDARQHIKRVTTSAPAIFLKRLQGSEGEDIHSSADVPRVESLDQLFAHAAVIQVILRRKVQIWALASGGSFPLMHPAYECVRWDIAKADQDLQSKIKWTQLKSCDRAIEKLVRSYEDDVSRLCDISREAIIFEDLDDLVKCVHAISCDLEVEVIRVKNRLSHDYQSWETAGFRSVQFNLRIVTEETTRLGIAAHICELQLLLKSIWKCKTNVGHSQYVAW
eukprot:CAMPEP_0184293364 /NCGR_PEP_ID=MMETSP1049-20130417/4816_1 /TAXON_ID=77928 /ORGANISM="Proteomonas sulcata, Strain CCMP704" /LENGTH=840 /DNA_ID=CAMNT_0026601327 /DNA_START=96 /DNA_END=2615 /DNA_ORIENTATION=-